MITDDDDDDSVDVLQQTDKHGSSKKCDTITGFCVACLPTIKFS